MRLHAAHEGWTPLHPAAHYGHFTIAKLLVEVGAEVEAVARNAVGNTPLSAVTFGRRGHIAEYLLNSGAKVDSTNRCGRTALHRASEKGLTDMVRLLIARGADVSRQTPEEG